MSDFFVTLQSNACMNIFPENKISDFKNKISSVITLKNNTFEVGLVECSYTYGNVFLAKETILGTLIKDGELIPMTVRKNLRTLEELLKELKFWMPKSLFTIEDHTFKSSLDLSDVSVEFSEKICDILGLDCGTASPSVNAVGGNYNVDDNYSTTNIHAHLEGTHPVFPNCGNTKLFIYCNVIAPQYVADVMAPCLRVICYDGDYRQQITHSFQHVHFMALSVSEFDVVHMYIRNESGESIPFEFGNFTATLRFRERKF
jgi:hypothetical protein